MSACCARRRRRQPPRFSSWERSESRDEWFTEIGSDCEIMRVEIDDATQSHSETNHARFQTLHGGANSVAHGGWGEPFLSTVYEGINAAGSRSSWRSEINAAQLFRSATVIAPAIILLREGLRGLRRLNDVSPVESEIAATSITRSPWSSRAGGGRTGVLTCKRLRPPSLLHLGRVLSWHLSSPLCQISLVGGGGGVRIRRTLRRRAGSRWLRMLTTTVLSPSPSPRIQGLRNAFSATLPPPHTSCPPLTYLFCIIRLLQPHYMPLAFVSSGIKGLHCSWQQPHISASNISRLKGREDGGRV